MCSEKNKAGDGPSRERKKMTLKELIKVVANDHAAIYPRGWDTEVSEIMHNMGRTIYTRRQRRVWELMIRTPYNGEAPTTTLFRCHDSAKAAMAEDIHATLASENPRFSAEDLVRQDEDNARIGDEIFWEIEQKDLYE